MGLAISEDHEALATTVRRWVDNRDTVAAARQLLDAEADHLPELWGELGELGWLGLAVSEANGGQGYGLAELAVVLEELGRGCVPGPMLSSAVAAIAVDRWGRDPGLVARLIDATAPAALALGPGLVVDGDRVTGTVSTVWGAATAEVLVLPVAHGGEGVRWVVLDRGQVEVRELPSFDPTRRLGEVTVDAPVVAERWLAPGAEVELVATLRASAELLGVADWCVGTAAAYACERVQFGRPIGQFQAVKHRCANMLMALEMARAAVWDAARALDEIGLGRAGTGVEVADAGGEEVAGAPDDEPDDEAASARLAAEMAAALAPEAAFACAKDCVQVLGGIGYTWEHDAHLYLKRATALRHLLAPPSSWRARLAASTAVGRRRSVSFELPDDAAGADEAARARQAVRAFVAELGRHDRSEWRGLLVDHGYLTPHWPKPWGLDASPIEQLVIDQELRDAHVRRPHLAVAGWALPTIIAHGSAEQQERFLKPTLRGELAWCQMFSEPGAGSDLAALSTRATRVDGGWSLTGQKVWTTLAREADFAICLARTDPDAPRHEGIGCFLLDMTTPGLEIRPLRELTGMAMFNEVFLTDVFVPDDDLVGSPTGGWAYARTTLANERVSMSSGSSFGPGLAGLFALAGSEAVGSGDPGAGGGRLVDDPLVADQLGGLVADAHAIAVLGMRATLRALGGGQPGPEASVRKLAGVTHEQSVQEAGLALLGPLAAVGEGPGAAWAGGFLGDRALSIAGGTSEIQRNVIAERLLGLPKDP
jgi:3-oxochol-4-en-24-oyl-CoA dehydrogenase